MDSIDSFIHRNKTFINDSFSRITNVEVFPGVDNFSHFVFSIPYTHMFSSPMQFKDFKNTAEANALQMCFTFFLDFCYSVGVSQSKKDTSFTFNDMVVVLEACKHENKDRYVGARVHVFTTRCPSEIKKLQSTLQYHLELKKKNAKIGEYELHKCITSAYSYANAVCNVYLNNSYGSSTVDSLFLETDTHELAPSNVFSLNNMSIRHAKHNDPTDYMRDGNIVFPDEDNILRICPDKLQPEVFMDRYLVDYLIHRVNPPEAHMTYNGILCDLELKAHSMRVDPPGLDIVDNTCSFPLQKKDEMCKLLKHFSILEISQQEAKNSFGFFKYNSLIADTQEIHNTSYMSMAVGDKMIYHPMLNFQSDLSDIDLIKIRGDKLRGEMDEVKRKQFILSEFTQRCWGDTDANISKPLKAVIRWFNNDYDGTVFSFPVHYEKLSVFANRAIRTIKVYDKLFFVSTAQHALFLLNHAKYDNWRHDMNLHFNICSTGDGATSKSFLFEIMIATSVPGTCPEFTYETAKSNAHDENNNHLRNVFQEAPQGMFTSNKHTDPQQEAAFKERLTSQRTSHRRLHIDEHTGVRKQVSSVSQAIGCYFGASNDPKSRSTPAMITRFHWLESEKVHREGRNIHDCQRAENSMDDHAKRARAYWTHFHQFEDMLVALVFQFIRVDLLDSPELVVADIIIDNFTVLLKKYSIAYEGRTIERTKILCTILTIVNALHELLFTPGGTHHGKTFRLEYLMDLNEHLVCTEEIALFAIGLMFNSIEQENHKKVLKAIWTLHKRTKEYRAVDEVQGEFDYNYIAMDNIKRLKQQIHGTIQEQEGKIGESAIESTLDELCKSQTMCSTYDMVAGNFGDGFPEQTAQKKYRRERIIVSNKTYIHMENFKAFREGTSSDIFKECLREFRHKHTKTHQILLGRRIRNKQGAVEHPHLFDTVMMQPANQSLMVSGGTQYTEDDDDIINIDDVADADDEILEEDLDSYGRKRRSNKLGYQVEKFEPDTPVQEREYPGNNLKTLFKKRKRIIKH